MRFSTSALLGIYFALFGGRVGAADNRLLYTIPAKETIETFRSCFVDTCAKGTWKPAHHKGLTYRGFIFQPGDYSGKHNDTEARLVCSWYNTSAPEPQPPSITFTREVAEYLGATKT
ncbi:hypothetical protein C8R43DRAFT_1236173 [Mycena crocata]|nr:hypothetical protein C8R43DRAFT_1236173 [Mycena crocata]